MAYYTQAYVRDYPTEYLSLEDIMSDINDYRERTGSKVELAHIFIYPRVNGMRLEINDIQSK